MASGSRALARPCIPRYRGEPGMPRVGLAPTSNDVFVAREPDVQISRIRLPSFSPGPARRSRPASVSYPPQCEGNGGTKRLKPWTAFPLYAAFPRAEYYAVLRLLPAHLPPSGLAWGGAYASATPGGLPCSDCPAFRHAALSDPAEVTTSSPVSDACCCLPGALARRPSDHGFTRLDRFTLRWRPGRRTVYASRPSSRTAPQDSLRRGRLLLRRLELHQLCSASFMAHKAFTLDLAMGGVDQHRAARPDDGAGGGSALQARTHRPTVPPGAEHLSRGPLVLVAHGRRPPGGISAILAELARRPGLLDLDAGTVSGVTLGELIAGARVGDHDVIRRSRRHTVKPAAWPYSRATSPPGDRW